MKYYGNRNVLTYAILAVILLAIAFFNTSIANAYDASGGSISSQVGLGTILLNSNSSNIIGGMNPAAVYYGGVFEGHFGIKTLDSNDTSPPIILLQSPQNHAVRTYSNTSFNFTASDSSGLENCTLYIDSAPVNTTYYPVNGAGSFIYQLTGGAHTWRIGCYDVNDNSQLSQLRHLSVILASTFDNDTTDLSSVNISSVPNLTLSKSGKGKIKFNTDTNLENITDLESHITITDLSISIDSAQIPILNKPATLTIHNIPYQYVAIMRDGEICDTCTINSYSDGTLIFDVQGFSTYTITSTSRLEIFDDTDVVAREIFDEIGFYANYSNVSSGEPITSQCDVSFNIGGWTTPVSMTFNSSTKLHQYYRTFNDSNTYDFNVSCQALTSGFDDLSLQEYFIVSEMTSGSLAEFNLTQISSTRYDDSRPAQSTNAESGNVSEIPINIDITSRAWQGYFGNVTGTMMLADSSGNAFYDWNEVSATGEILATRNATVDWNTINCADQQLIDNEDVFLQKTSLDSDSVNNTFAMTNHPLFMVSTTIMSGCRSTRTFRGNSQIGFWNIVLSDSTGAAVYTGIIDSNNYNFKNSTSDFELLVPAPSGSTHTYYFYMELS
ncbi:MAG: hypothetical protein ACP5NV_04205 [Candidatus Woesearchaeota archaeon]